MKCNEIILRIVNISSVYDEFNVFHSKMLKIGFRSPEIITENDFKIGDFDYVYLGNLEKDNLCDEVNSLEEIISKKIGLKSIVNVRNLLDNFCNHE